MAVDYGADARSIWRAPALGCAPLRGISPRRSCPRPWPTAHDTRREASMSRSIPCPATRNERPALPALSPAAGCSRRRCPDPGGPWRVYAWRRALCAPNCQRACLDPVLSIADYEAGPAAWHDLGAQRVVLATGAELWRRFARSGPRNAAGVGAGDLCPRGDVRLVLRALPALQLYDRAGIPTGAPAPSPAAISTP